ncbi:hypothetical protein BQ8482_100187 [Mesorhizobium delmotii]|uniref:Uncharacterized protein n=1 Tax=Mesorhizobium delmotii TaxID=1631247 RepID=A0A2P9AA46_9HYPH|nr:hypothetical protein BQ8482_100187 [Mesorhizobium delmotii]
MHVVIAKPLHTFARHALEGITRRFKALERALRVQDAAL